MSLQQMLPYRLPKIKNKMLLDPHVVILGAGASIAACPIDKNGQKVPALSNIHKTLGLTDMLSKYNFSLEEMADFEKLFSKINGKEDFVELQSILEVKVQQYFKKLQLPDNVTIYDYLILSLTSKDLIISFNWDPFLLQAYLRNISVGNLPQVVFPHGNVGVGVCYNCKKKGYVNYVCPTCGKPFSNMKLLFPVKHKNYNEEQVIKNEWTVAKNYLRQAAGVTIFGYGAPESDYEAYNLLKNSYLQSEMTYIAPFTIINLNSEKDTQLQKWSEIYDKKMIEFSENFQETMLWTSPRVSLETLFDAILQQRPREHINSFNDFNTLEELQLFVKTINNFEMAI